jgi:hypothetical protein
MRVTIDRFEGEFAVVEMQSGEFVNMTKSLLPPNSKEGDVISIKIDQTDTATRRAEIEDKMNRLFED